MAAVRKQVHIKSKQPHADKTAHQSAEETVAAVETALLIAAAHAKDGTDAGKGRAAVQKIVDQGTQRCRQSGFNIAKSHFREDKMCQFFPHVHMTLHSLLPCKGVLKENGYPLIFR